VNKAQLLTNQNQGSELTVLQFSLYSIMHSDKQIHNSYTFN